MNGGYKHTINHAYDALGKLVSELKKATTEDQRVVVMEHWKSSCLIFDRSLHHTTNFVYAKSYDRKKTTIEKAIELDMQCLAKRVDDEKKRLARCIEMQASLEALLSS